MKNGNSPAMPTHDVFQDCGFDGNSGPHLTQTTSYGLTKREMMAMHVMAAQISAVSSWEAAEMLTNAIDERGIDRGHPEKLLTINAVNYADALLAELERTK